MSSAVSLQRAGRLLGLCRCRSFSGAPAVVTTNRQGQWYLKTGFGDNVILARGMKTTSTIHPKPVFDDEEKVLEKILQEREKSEDLPIVLTNPYEKPIKKCILCEHKIVPDYKNTKILYQFVSPYTGTVYGRHITGLCKKMQEKVEAECLLAVNLGFMSNFLKEVEFLKDPKLCDPERPARSHKY